MRLRAALFVAGVVFVSIFLHPPFVSQAANEVPQPPFKTLKITYKTTNREFDKNQKLISENSGQGIRLIDVVQGRQREENVVTDSLSSPPSDMRQFELFDGKNHYMVDLVKNEAFPLTQRWQKGPVWLDLDMNLMNRYRIGTEEVLGRTCDVYKIPGDMELKSWFWNGILLKQETKMDRFFSSREAVAVEEDVPIEEGYFELPQGVSIQSLDSAATEEAKRLTEELPKPPFKTIRIVYKTAQKNFDEEQNPVLEKEGTAVKLIDAVQGKKRVEQTTHTRFGADPNRPPMKEEGLEIFDREKHYIILQNFNVAISDIAQFPVWVDQIFHDKYRTGRQETLLGRVCDVYDAGGNLYWVWNHLILKEEWKFKNFYSLSEAVEVEEDVKIEPDKFALPEGVTIQTQDTFAGSLEKGVASSESFLNSQEEWFQTLADKIGIKGIRALALTLSVYNPDEEHRVIRAINEDPGMSSEEKQAKVKLFQEAVAERRKIMEQAVPEYVRKGWAQLKFPPWISQLETSARQELEGATYQAALIHGQMLIALCEDYRRSRGAYPESLRRLLEVDASDVLKNSIEKMESEEGFQDYRFFYTFVDKDHFQLLAKPLAPEAKTVFVDETGVFHLDSKGGPVIDREKEFRP